MKAWLTEHAAILILVLATGIAYGLTLDSHGMFMWDEAEYASLSRSISEGDGFSISGHPNSLRPPLLPLSGVLSATLGGGFDDVALKSSVWLFSLLGLVAIYLLGSKLWDRRVATISCAILAFTPEFWSQSSFFLSEAPFSLFFSAAVLAFIIGLEKDHRYFGVAWIAWGMAVLTRYTAVLFGPISMLIMVAFLFRDRQRLVSALQSKWFWLSPVGALVLVGPWLLRQYLTFGDALVGFKTASGQLQTYLPGVSMPSNFYFEQLPAMLSWPVLILFVLGTWTILRSRSLTNWMLLLVCVFFWGWFSGYRYKEVRLISAILPFLAIIAGTGLNFLWKEVVGSRVPGWTIGVLGAICLGVIFPTRSSDIRNTTTLGGPGFKEAMVWIGDNSPRDAILMTAATPQAWWYSRRKTIGFPSGIDQLSQTLDDVDFVLITNFERGQPSWVTSLGQYLTQQDVDSGDVRVFSDERFQTLVVETAMLEARLSGEADSQ